MRSRFLALLLALSMLAAMAATPAYAATEDVEDAPLVDQLAPETEEEETPEEETPVEEEAPDSETPDEETPDGETPDSETPDGETPDGETPDEETPDEETPDEETPEEEVVSFFPSLITEEHIVYIQGKSTGYFDPQGKLTRAEAATMIASLLDTDEQGEVEYAFTDLAEDAWYSSYVSLMASWGIFSGYTNGTVCPTNNITRAEFVTILCKICQVDTQEDAEEVTEEVAFTDVPSTHWASAYISYAAQAGWVSGYTDGSFCPDQGITRAEAVVVLNNVLGRSASAEETKALLDENGVRPFADVYPTNWYYTYIMEAAVSHTYTCTPDEVWTDFTYKAGASNSGWVTVNGYKYYVNSNLQFEAWPSGLLEMDDALYYVDSLGRIPLNAAGLYTVDGVKYYVNSSGIVPQGSVGIYSANGYKYYVTEDGSVPQGAAGAYTVNGTTYYVNSSGIIPQNSAGVVALSSTTGYLISNTGVIQTYSAGTQYIDSELYYFNSDGTVALNTTVRYLYFGSDGKYTSGNSSLDTMVKAALAKCVTSSMTQSQMLRKAYLYVRDNFTYRSLSHYSRGTTYWTESCAVYMFTNSKGNCYCFASAFMYMARQLGYQAYAVSGGVGSANSDHAWIMIPWSDGATYMFDVELDYAYRYRYNRGVTYDLYKFTKSSAPFTYYFP